MKIFFLFGFIAGVFDYFNLLKIRDCIYKKSARYNYGQTINGFDYFYDLIGI